MTDGGIFMVLSFEPGEMLPKSQRARTADEAMIMLSKINPEAFGMVVKIPVGVPVSRSDGEVIATLAPGPRD